MKTIEVVGSMALLLTSFVGVSCTSDDGGSLGGGGTGSSGGSGSGSTAGTSTSTSGTSTGSTSSGSTSSTAGTGSGIPMGGTGNGNQPGTSGSSGSSNQQGGRSGNGGNGNGNAGTGNPPSGAGCDTPGLDWKTANKTWFESYPAPGSEECIEFNGCEWAGQFAFCDDKKPESWVSEHNIVAAFPAGGLEGHDLCIKKGNKTLVVTVLDTCGDSDCDGCCTENLGDADALIDLEKYTNERWGVDDGEIQFADLGANSASCD